MPTSVCYLIGLVDTASLVKNLNEKFSPKISNIPTSTRQRLSINRNYNRESNFEILHDTDSNRFLSTNRDFNKVSRPKGSSEFFDWSSHVPEPTKVCTTKIPYNSIQVASTKTFNTDDIDNVDGEKTISWKSDLVETNDGTPFVPEYKKKAVASKKRPSDVVKMELIKKYQNRIRNTIKN